MKTFTVFGWFDLILKPKEHGLFMTVWLTKKSDKEKVAARVAEAALKQQASGMDVTLGNRKHMFCEIDLFIVLNRLLWASLLHLQS